VHYRAYILDKDGRISQAIDLDCVDDEDAKKQASKLLDGHDIEVWQQKRRLTILMAGSNDQAS